MSKEMLSRIFRVSILLVVLGTGCSRPAAPAESISPGGGFPDTARLFEPVRPIGELRDEALLADPPAETESRLEPDLVEVVRLDPEVRLDVRYATDDNFLGAAVYESPRVFLQRPVAEALLAAARELRERGYGIVIFDGYRPWYVTRIFWDATPVDKKAFVADPVRGSRHNRGAAVDLTLCDLASGAFLPMPSGYDETTERAGIEYTGGDPLSRANRDLLIGVMRRHGFEPLANEWWHYDHLSWRDYPIMNIRFDDIAGD